MVFKGTPRRTALDVNRDFDRIGADYNAFTSEENTVFYAAVLPEYLPQAVDMLADILRPRLRSDDFDTEKNVIIEEIGMYEDQPTWSAYDHAKRLYFADHPLGNSDPRHAGEHHGPDAATRWHAYFTPPLRRPERHRRRRPAISTWTGCVDLVEQALRRLGSRAGRPAAASGRPPGSGQFEVHDEGRR